MENNCLVTKLKSTVQNNSLKKLGVLMVETDSSASIKQFLISSNKAITLTAQGGNFVDSSGENPSSTQSIPADRNITVYLEGGKEIFVSIPEKYEINTLRMAVGVFIPDISSIEYCTKLNILAMVYYASGTIKFERLTDLTTLNMTYAPSEFRGNIEELVNATSLEELWLDHSSGFAGNISTLAGLSSLKYINLANTYIEGDANIFADNTKFAGLSLSGAELVLTNAYGITNRTVEVKALIEAAHPGITVTI